MRSMRVTFYSAVCLMLASRNPAYSEQSNALNQLQGLWTVKWTAQGNMNVQQTFFIADPSDFNTRIASLPFLPGQVRISYCQGMGCSGANIDVSGTDFDGKGFDCLYNHSRYDENKFAWTYKNGTSTKVCFPDAVFERVGAATEAKPQAASVRPSEQKDSDLSGLSIQYNPKEKDGSIVRDALTQAGVHYITEKVSVHG